ncbi:MAG TPA: hypothetical protein VFF04_02380 [Candidatus Babeliales bacterium]|nr:hypothetical protein [Candidatus Babeliales bacterium]
MKKKLLIIFSSIVLLSGAIKALNAPEKTSESIKFNAYLKKSAIETQKNYENRLRALATLIYWQVAEINPAAEANNTCAVFILEANDMIKGLIIANFKSVEPVITEITDNAPAIGIEFPELLEYYNEFYHKILEKLPKNSKFYGTEKRVLPKNIS